MKVRKGFICLVLIVISFTSSKFCPGQGSGLTAEIKKQTIDSLSALLPERYAYKEIGPKLGDMLQQNLKAGRYDSFRSPVEFSIAVTNDMRSLNPDRHLALNYSPEAPNPNPSSTPPPITPEERAREVAIFNRQMNYGFKDVRFLNGNIGYLKLDYFDADLNYSRRVADASMLFFKNSDAIIIDLRENGGGSAEMVGYISGFFFKEKTLSGTSYDRLTDSSSDGYIIPQPKETQLSDIDVYILTSKVTASAAESLAYTLKYLRNAKVLGETSAGAANPGRITRLNSLFTAFIPNRHGVNVVTGTNWEGTGVPVDITCPAEDALRVARIEALKKMRQRATDSLQQKRFDSYLTYLEKAAPGMKVPEKTLLQFAGKYQGGRAIIVKDGALYTDRGERMFYVGSDIFMLNEGDTTITFNRDGRGRVKEWVSQWSLRSNSTTVKKIDD